MSNSPAAPPSSPPGISSSFPWLRLFVEGKHAQLCENFINTIEASRTLDFSTLDPFRRYNINSFLASFLFILSQPEFQIPPQFTHSFLLINPYISSLAALSGFGNTDPWLEILRHQPNSYVKILCLYSARNTVQFDRQAIFNANPGLASLWYTQYVQIHRTGLPSKTVYDNLRDHFSFSPPHFVPVMDMTYIYFGSTYIAGHVDHLIKPCLNAAIQKALAPMSPPPPPNPRKIAIVSAVWNAGHSAARICAGMLRALKPHFHLTFLQIGDYFDQETSLFDAVFKIQTSNGFPQLPADLPRDFQAAIFPDVGMSNESIILSNQRLAPIQIALLGHSVSTFGAQIDYFISGAAVEPPDAQNFYSEKLVLLPGFGCTHEKPEYPRPTLPAPEPPLSPNQPLIINCPWSAQKINYPFLQTLRQLAAGTTRPILFRIFGGLNPAVTNNVIPLAATLAAALAPPGSPHQVDLVRASPYPDYMALMQQGHFSLDAFHFGGCNTVSDSLYLGIPMLCREGDRWYNRIGPAMLRRVDLPELIATNESEYLAIAHRLIHDDNLRRQLRTRLTPALYSDDDAPHFLTAINHLIQNHPHLQSTPSSIPIQIQ